MIAMYAVLGTNSFFDCGIIESVETYRSFGSLKKFIANRYETSEVNLHHWMKKHKLSIAVRLLEVYIYIKNTKLYLWQSQRYYIKYQMILNF